MANVFRQRYYVDLPANAIVFTKQTAKGSKQFAKWKSSSGAKREGEVKPSKDGRSRVILESGTYYVRYRDGRGIVRTVSTGCRTEAGARDRLTEYLRDAEQVRAGRLSASTVEAKDRLGNSYLDTVEEYLQSLESLERKKSYIDDLRRRLKRFAKECKFITLRDITKEQITRWFLDAAKRDSNGKAKQSARSRNANRQAFVSFCEWCLSEHRMPGNPAAELPVAEQSADVRRKRRAISIDELSRLLYVARWRPLAEYGRVTESKKAEETIGRSSWTYKPLTYETMPQAIERAKERLADNPSFIEELSERGRERALIYRTLLLTGLRRGELAALKVSQVVLDLAPRIELEAGQEKNAKGSVLPLNSDLASELRLWLDDLLRRVKREARGQNGESIPIGGIPTMLPGSMKLFNVPNQLVKILDRDLQAAGIAKKDERDRTIDVHAMRHTHCTMLSRSGAAPRTAQAAMRHSQIDLTMRVYTDETQLAVRDAVEALPILQEAAPSERKKQTGTEGQDPSYIRSYIGCEPFGAFTGTSVQSSTSEARQPKSKKALVIPGKQGDSNNRASRTRTYDLRIRNPLLYPTEL